MSSALVNIVIGLVTSIIGGGSVWLWQRARNVRLLRRKERFFGLEPGKACLIVMNNKYNMVGSANHNDVQAVIELATLASSLNCPVTIESCNDVHGINGDRTEFCVGGPAGGSNPRTGGHLAANLPGVTLCPFDPARRDSMAILAGAERFLWDAGNQEYALVAKFTPTGSSRPVIIICGQTAIANRAAVHYLKREYRKLSPVLRSLDRFCIIVRAAAIGTYGYQASELASDVSEAAFLPPLRPSGPGAGARASAG
jgi:hypothetical protein